MGGDYLSPAGGAACFTSGVFGAIDCVSWGAFTGATLPSATGGPAPVIGSDQALERRRPACGSGVADTDSPSNWIQGAPDPFNNAAAAATIPPCPDTRFTKTPPKRTAKRKAKFMFTATPPADSPRAILAPGGAKIVRAAGQAGGSRPAQASRTQPRW